MSKKVAYGGILLAVNIIILLLLNIIPINTMFLMGLASLPISIAIMELGLKSGIAFYMGSTILSFMVMTNKAQWVLYISTFGLYGIVKYIIEKNKSIYMEYLLKMVFANVIIVIVYFILKQFVYIPLNLITIATFEVAFIVYDYVYTSFIHYYNQNLKKRIKKI